MVDFLRIQVTSFGEPDRTDRHPEDASGLLVIASRLDVGVGQPAAHDWTIPAGLLRALGMDPVSPLSPQDLELSRLFLVGASVGRPRRSG